MRKSIIGMLLGNWIAGSPEGQANPAVGAEEQFDENGKSIGFIKHNEDTDEDATADAKKYGTGALRRPSVMSRVNNPEAAARIDAINSSFAAMPAESKQRFDTEQGMLVGQIKKAYNLSTGKELDSTEAQKWAAAIGTKALSAGMSPGEVGNTIQHIAENKSNVPTMMAQLQALKTSGDTSEQETFMRNAGPESSGRGRAALANLAGEQAESSRRLIPQEETTRGSELQERELMAKGSISRMPITQSVLDSDALNRLVESTQVAPKQIQFTAKDLEYRLGRQPTENEVEREVLKNRLWEQQNVSPLQLDIEKGKAQATQEAIPDIRQTIRNTAASNAISSGQPPDINRPYLFKPNMDQIAAGNYRKAYAPVGLNPWWQNPMATHMLGAQQFMDTLGKGASGQMKLGTLPGGGIVGPPTGGAPVVSRPPVTAPMSSAITAAQVQPTPQPTQQPPPQSPNDTMVGSTSGLASLYKQMYNAMLSKGAKPYYTNP